MVSLKTPIVLVGIAIAIIVLILSFRKFALPALGDIGESLSETLGGFGSGITDFFNSFDIGGSNNNDSQELTPNPEPTIFVDDPKDPDGDSVVLAPPPLTINPDPSIPIEIGGGGAGGFEIDEDSFNTESNDEGKGFFDDIFGNLFQTAFADDSSFSKTSNSKKKPQGNTTIQGNVRTELEAEQNFQVFSSDSSRPVRGVIRKTKRDPKKLKVDSKKNPLETASERASRVFEETGKFVDENRGFGVTSGKDKTKNFNFGTNTGKGLKKQTNSKNSKLRTAEKLKLEAEKASKIFDSRGITNF